ncbi:MAG: glycosyltransferase family A protein [Candidatus Bathyarchaeia archaeon]
MTGESAPNISVIVCTRNRVRSLEKCLDSLLSLNYPKSEFEIVVVDNNSDDETRVILQSKYSNVVRYIFESRIGIAYARNTGVKHARGSIIAFIDDDCIPDKNWLKELIKGFKSSEIIGVGGPTRPLNEKIPKSKTVHSVLGTFDRGTREQYVSFVGSGNCAFKREALNLTLFDVNMKVSEDVGFCLILTRLGYKLLYVPSAITYTLIPPNRLGIKPVIQRGFSDGESYLYLNLQTKSWPKCLIFLIIHIIHYSIRFFKKRNYRNFYRLLIGVSAIVAIPNVIRLRKLNLRGRDSNKSININKQNFCAGYM